MTHTSTKHRTCRVIVSPRVGGWEMTPSAGECEPGSDPSAPPAIPPPPFGSSTTTTVALSHYGAASYVDFVQISAAPCSGGSISVLGCVTATPLKQIDQCVRQPANGASTTYGTLLRDLYVSLPDVMLKLGGLSLVFPM